MKASRVLLALPLVLVIGLCLHTYHVCGSARAAGGHPFSGTCGDGASATNHVTVARTSMSAPSDAASPLVPSELWVLLELIVTVVERSVYGYFLTFAFGWVSILAALVTMIDRYIAYLGHLTDDMVAHAIPFTIALGVALLGVALILQVILSHIIPRWTPQDSSACGTCCRRCLPWSCVTPQSSRRGKGWGERRPATEAASRAAGWLEGATNAEWEANTARGDRVRGSKCHAPGESPV